MFKLKLKKIKEPPITLIYRGKEVMDLPEGSILKVISNSTSNTGDIIVRTHSNIQPLKTIKPLNNPGFNDNGLWGTSLGGYRFELLPFDKLTNYINET